MKLHALKLCVALLAGSVFGSSAFAQASDEAAPAARGVHTVKACAAEPTALHARCHAQIVVDEAGEMAVSATPSGFGPADLQSAYKITTSGSSTTTIAIVDAYHYKNADKDLGVYRAQYGLPACTTANGCFKQVDEHGGTSYPKVNVGWNQEEALDLDMASAMCPNCKIVLVEAKSSSYNDLGTAVNTAAGLPGVHVISNSYGGGESGTSTYEGDYNHPGIAVTVSTGDSGYGVQFPASSPHVIAVGGTHLVKASNSRGWTETAWTGAGSGCSTTYAKPSWQHDSGCTKRTVADVSAVADPNTGVAVYGPKSKSVSAWMVFGGTSVAAPLIGGVYGNNGGAVNYGADPYSHTSALNDVVGGSNGSCGGSYLCTAVTGYDGPTGLGTPIGTTAF